MTSNPPRASRPCFQPDYGVPGTLDGMLEWATVDAKLATAATYWVTTTSPNGVPQSSPVWGVWIDGALYFSCGSDSQKARNFHRNPSIEFHLESGDDVVIVKGLVENAPGGTADPRIIGAFKAKYGADRMPGDTKQIGGGLFVVRPTSALAWTCFPTDVTRWDF